MKILLIQLSCQLHELYACALRKKCLLHRDKSPLGFQETGFIQRWKGVDFVERADSDLKVVTVKQPSYWLSLSRVSA